MHRPEGNNRTCRFQVDPAGFDEPESAQRETISMGQWLHSGRRRDLCVLLYGTDGLRAQELKTRLETHYEQRIEPTQFRRALEQLVDQGHVTQEADGIQERYRLTNAGQAALEAHERWRQDELA